MYFFIVSILYQKKGSIYFYTISVNFYLLTIFCSTLEGIMPIDRYSFCWFLLRWGELLACSSALKENKCIFHKQGMLTVHKIVWPHSFSLLPYSSYPSISLTVHYFQPRASYSFPQLSLFPNVKRKIHLVKPTLCYFHSTEPFYSLECLCLSLLTSKLALHTWLITSWLVQIIVLSYVKDIRKSSLTVK